MNKKVHVRKIPPPLFARMKILAHANGFPLKNESEVFRICYLADSFRGIYVIEHMRRDLRKKSRSLKGEQLKYLIATVLLISFVAVSQIAEDEKHFVLIYSYDTGICEPNIAFPEGGCPHIYAKGVELFSTEQGALDWADEHTDQEFQPGGVYMKSTPRIDSDTPLTLLKIDSAITLAFAMTGKTYEAYENVPTKINKPLKQWQAKR